MKFLPPFTKTRWFILAAITLIFTASVLAYNHTKKASPGIPVAALPGSLPDSVETVVPAAPGQDITWSQQQVVTHYIFPEDSTSTSLTFTSARNLQNIALQAVPEIAGFVAIQPSSFANIPAGQTQAVALSFSIPSGTTFKTYEGTIHVRSGQQTLPQVLKVVVNIGVPPDPGEAGKATLEGIDSDRDGVRDDIQRYIALTYPGSQRTRAALTQFAKTALASLIDAENRQASINDAIEMQYANECLHYVRSSDARTVGDLLLAEIVNTEARIRAYINFNEQLGGETFPGTPRSQRKSRCAFNPDALEN